MGEEASASAPDIFYVCERVFNSINAKLKEGKDITDQELTDLTLPDGLADDEIMIPVDMRGLFDDYDDTDQMVEKLGAKKSAEVFIKAKENFDANKDNEPEEERPKKISAKEWKEILDAEQDANLLECGEEEEDLLLEGEEEELDDDDDEDEDEGEPAAKKAKTD